VMQTIGKTGRQTGGVGMGRRGAFRRSSPIGSCSSITAWRDGPEIDSDVLFAETQAAIATSSAQGIGTFDHHRHGEPTRIGFSFQVKHSYVINSNMSK
jgi:hypothetical protein